MWNSAELVRQERYESDSYRQAGDMFDLLEERLSADAIDEWLLDVCHEVARFSDIDDPNIYLEMAKDILRQHFSVDKLNHTG